MNRTEFDPEAHAEEAVYTKAVVDTAEGGGYHRWYYTGGNLQPPTS